MNIKKLSILFVLLGTITLSSCGQEELAPCTDRYIEGKIHDNNSSTSDVVFAQINNSTDFKIVIPDVIGEYSNLNTVSSYLTKHIKKACKVEIEVITESSYDKNKDKGILLGCSDSFEEDRLVYPKKIKNVSSSYYIKTKGNSTHIQAKDNDGYQLGAMKFLQLLVGYDYIQNGYTYYDTTLLDDNTAVKMLNFDVVEASDFTGRRTRDYVFSNLRRDAGYTIDDTIGSFAVTTPAGTKFNYFMHNCWWYLSGDFETHRKWFRDQPGYEYRDPSTPVYDICYLAHGDVAEQEALANRLFELAKQCMLSAPNALTFAFTQMDTSDSTQCKCDACSAYKAQYGPGWFTGSIIRIMNKADNLLQAYIADPNRTEYLDIIPRDREFGFVFAAYSSGQSAPVKFDEKGVPLKGEDGKYILLNPEFKANKHVSAYTCTAAQCYSLYDTTRDDMVAKSENIKAWSQVCDTIYWWGYVANYGAYMYSTPAYYVHLENLKFFAENGCTYAYPENQDNNTNCPGFGQLLDYLNIRACIDINQNVQTMTNDYFSHAYYGAKDTMKDFFDSYYSWQMKNIDIYSVINATRTDMCKAEYWPLGLLKYWENLCDKALLEIDYLKDIDLSLYENVANNIILESITPRFMHLTLYENSYQTDNLKAERISFKNDCQTLMVRNSSEYVSLNDLYNSWGI